MQDNERSNEGLVALKANSKRIVWVSKNEACPNPLPPSRTWALVHFYSPSPFAPLGHKLGNALIVMPKSPTLSPKKAIRRNRSSVPDGAIQKLNSSLLLDIFAHLRSVKGLSTCSLVCRKWHALVRLHLILNFIEFVSCINFASDLSLSSICALIQDMDVRLGDGPFFFSKRYQPSPPSQRYQTSLPISFVSCRTPSKPSICT